MSLKNEFNHIALTSSVRPHRMAVLTDINDKNWINNCLAIIHMFSKMWGGHYNIIIPTDGIKISGTFWNILKQYNPDYIFYFQSTYRQLKYFNKEEYDQLLKRKYEAVKRTVYLTIDRYEEIIKDNPINNFRISESLQEEIYNKHYLFGSSLRVLKFNDRVVYPITNIFEIIGNYDKKDQIVNSLQTFAQNVDCGLTKLLLTSYFGYLEGDIEQIPFGRLLHKMYSLDDIERKPFDISLIGTSYTVDVKYNDFEPKIAIVGSTVSDFCLYYCLSRLKNKVIWLADESNYINTRQATRYMNISIFDYINPPYLFSVSKNETELKSIRKSLLSSLLDFITIKDNLIQDKKIEDFINKIKVLYNTNNINNTDVLLLKNNLSISPIDTPIPKDFRRISPVKHRWVTDVKFDEYIFPQKSYLSKKIFVAENYSSQEVRLSNKGLSYLSPNVSFIVNEGDDINNIKVKPKINIPNTFDIFLKTFSEIGYNIKYSDKGLYEHEFIDKFGVLEKLDELLSDMDYVNVLNKFLDNKPNIPGNYMNGVWTNKRRYLDSNSIKSLIDGNEKDKISKTIILIDEFVKKGIFERGFILKCSKCRNTDWYNITKVTDKFQCNRCNQINYHGYENYKVQPEPRFEPLCYYKLNEIIFHAYNNDSIVPILTLAKLKKASKKSFQYITEIAIYKDTNSGKPEMEIDICCIVDGQIVIGECKKGNKLEDKGIKDQQVINKYNSIAKKIKADILVFSSLANWRKETKQKIEALKTNGDLKVFILENDILTGQKELDI